MWDLLVLLFMESSICTVCTYSDFSLVCQLNKYDLETILTIFGGAGIAIGGF